MLDLEMMGVNEGCWDERTAPDEKLKERAEEKLRVRERNASSEFEERMRMLQLIIQTK